MLQEKYKNFYFFLKYFENIFKFGGPAGIVSATTLCLWARQT
jgi:hypothetical protein